MATDLNPCLFMDKVEKINLKVEVAVGVWPASYIQNNNLAADIAKDEPTHAVTAHRCTCLLHTWMIT